MPESLNLSLFFTLNRIRENSMMPHKNTEAYQAFLDSMNIGFDQWHDGTGYDLDALAQLAGPEQASIEQLLIGKLANNGDWRDLEALASLGTPSAQQAIQEARRHQQPGLRSYALQVSLENLDPATLAEADRLALEQEVIQALKAGNYELAEYLPSQPIKKALLDALPGLDPVTRVNAAAFLMYLCGLTTEPFDWSLRPFFLRFGEEEPAEVQQAWEELRVRTGF